METSSKKEERKQLNSAGFFDGFRPNTIPVCILTIQGVPSGGKTMLAKKLAKQWCNSEEHNKALLLNYEDQSKELKILPQNKYTPNALNNIQQKLQNTLDTKMVVIYKIQTAAENLKTQSQSIDLDSQQSSVKEIKDVNNYENFDIYDIKVKYSEKSKEKTTKLLIIVDDQAGLKLGREEIAKTSLARGAIAASIHVKCSIESCIKRNAAKTINILSESVLSKMFKHYEELISDQKYSIDINSETEFNENILNELIQMVDDAINSEREQPKVTMDSLMDSSIKDNKMDNLKNEVFALNLRLEKIIEDIKLKEIYKNLNSRAKFIVEQQLTYNKKWMLAYVQKFQKANENALGIIICQGIDFYDEDYLEK